MKHLQLPILCVTCMVTTSIPVEPPPETFTCMQCGKVRVLGAEFAEIMSHLPAGLRNQVLLVEANVAPGSPTLARLQRERDAAVAEWWLRFQAWMERFAARG